MSQTLTAHAPLDMIVMKLAAAGWGVLAGREWHGLQKVLVALAAHDGINNKTGQGFATVDQIGVTASLSETWTRSRLQLLEDLGALEWRRGGIKADGRPAPSWFRVVKERLLELIMAARPLRDQRDKERWAATRARVAHLYYLRGVYLRGVEETRNRRKRRSVHPQVSVDPPPLFQGEFTTTPPGRSYIADVCDEHGGFLRAKCRPCGAASGRTQHQAG